jgi:hypothetical protein
MSPEQARGKAADERADVWAFGCVLFEMLTGRRAFEGTGVSETLARVLERDPQWEKLPATLSPSLRTYLGRCLQKDPKQRVQSMGDVRLALEGAFEAAAPSAVAVKRTGAPMRLALVAAVVTIGALTAALAWIALRAAPPRWRAADRTLVRRLNISGNDRDLAITPGVHTSCIPATGHADLLRALDALHGSRGTPARHSIRVSRWKWIGFTEGGGVLKSGISRPLNHVATPIRPPSEPRGPDDTIIFATNPPNRVRASPPRAVH